MAIEAMQHIHENAYHKGYRDFCHGNLDNPFRKDTLFAKEWQRGFNAAYFVNLEYNKTRTNFILPRSKFKVKSNALSSTRKPDGTSRSKR